MPRGPSIKVVRDVVRLGVRGIETSLDNWMRDNFEALKEELRPHRANWEMLAQRLGEAGLTNAAGGKLTAATARKTWQRIRVEMTAAPSKQRPGSHRSPPVKPGAPAKDETPRTEPTDLDELPPRHTFRPAKIR